MTKKELSRISMLERELERYDEELERLESISPVKGQQLTGMPFGQSGCSDKVGNIATKKADLQLLIKSTKIDIEDEITNIMLFIENIDDMYIRQIMHYRYIDKMSWYQVARKMGGSADSIRMTHNRFWNKEENQEVS